jgi:hypothetical protein
VAEDRLGLKEIVEAVLAPFTAVAAGLVAAERGAQVAGEIDGDLPGPELGGRFARLDQVGAADMTGQALVSIVGDYSRTKPAWSSPSGRYGTTTDVPVLTRSSATSVR